MHLSISVSGHMYICIYMCGGRERERGVEGDTERYREKQGRDRQKERKKERSRRNSEQNTSV